MAVIYILDTDNRTPVPLAAHIEFDRWSRWMRTHQAARIVAQTTVGFVFVSTVFTGIALPVSSDRHREERDGPPGTPDGDRWGVFETMINTPVANYFMRAASWAEAEANHARAVADMADAQGQENPLAALHPAHSAHGAPAPGDRSIGGGSQGTGAGNVGEGGVTD